MKTLSVYDVFTPTTQAKLNYIDRKRVEHHLNNALRTPGKQVVVYGESGSGKSTLLQRQLNALNRDHIITRCSSTSTFANVLLDAFDQLDAYYVDARSSERSTGVKSGLGAQFLALKATVDSHMSSTRQDGSKRILPPQLTPQRLGEFMGAQHLCWVLEDFHKVLNSEKTALAQTFKVFSDLAAAYRDLKIIAIGATDTAREVVHYDREMTNRVAEIHVPLMDRHELIQLVINGSRLLNVDASSIHVDIVSFSTGLASVAHHLSLNACLAAGVEMTTRRKIGLESDHLESAVKKYLDESSDTLKALFESALERKRQRKYDNTRLILKALAGGPLDGMTHAQILSVIRENYPDYPAGNVTQYLRQLMQSERGGVVRKTSGGMFRFTEPIFHSYAQQLLGVKQPYSDAWSERLVFVFNAAVDSIVERWQESNPTDWDWFTASSQSDRVNSGAVGGRVVEGRRRAATTR